MSKVLRLHPPPMRSNNKQLCHFSIISNNVWDGMYWKSHRPVTFGVCKFWEHNFMQITARRCFRYLAERGRNHEQLSTLSLQRTAQKRRFSEGSTRKVLYFVCTCVDKILSVSRQNVWALCFERFDGNERARAIQFEARFSCRPFISIFN